MKRRKKITIKDIAKKLDISLATVSQALNHPREVSRDTVRRVMEKCNQLGYVKKTWSKKRKGVLGVIAQDIYNLVLGEYYNFILEGVLSEAQKQKIRLEIEFLAKTEIPLMVSKNTVDGILLFGKVSKELILSLKQKGIPLILVGHPVPNIELNTVMADGRRGIYEVTKHLIELGHKNIALVYSRPIHDYITADRIEGYRFALTEAKIKFNENYLAKADWCHPESSYEATLNLLNLKTAPTAIIYVNDTMAYRAYRAFSENKIRIPRDISIAGFDDMRLPDYIEPYNPRLTTVRVDRKLMGKTAVQLLLNLIENPSKIAMRYTLPVELRVKDSTSSPKKEKNSRI